MELWRPPHDSEHQLAWWAPLVRASRRARRERIPWPIHVDEFELRGRIDRRGRPSIWIYAHHRGGELALDDTGQPYRFFATPRSPGLGQFRPCALRRAVWLARLPEVVAPVWYDHATDEPDPAGAVPAAAGAAPRSRPDHRGPASRHPVPGRGQLVELPLRHRHVVADLDDHDDLDDTGWDDGLELPPPPAPGVRRRRHLGIIDGGRVGA